MIGHLGARVSALLDGQMTAEQADEAWAHVYACHLCRDLVEREGWVKTRLAGLGEHGDVDGCTSALKGSLMSLTPPSPATSSPRRSGLGGVHPGMALVGGGALGAAVVGMLALGVVAAPGGAERRPPVAQINTTSPGLAGATTTPTTVTPILRRPIRAAAELPMPLERFFG